MVGRHVPITEPSGQAMTWSSNMGDNQELQTPFSISWRKEVHAMTHAEDNEFIQQLYFAIFFQWYII